MTEELEFEQPDEDRLDPVTLFAENLQKSANDLIYLGYLTKTINFCGHTFVLETLRPYMKHAIGQALQPYRNTLAEPDVWAALHVGIALKSVNGDSEFCPPTQDSPVSFAAARLRWLTGPEGYWAPTITYLYAKYIEMEQEVTDTITELHRLSEEDRDTSPPSPDSSTDSGPLEPPTDLVSPPLVPFN